MREQGVFQPCRKESHPPHCLTIHCASGRASWVMTTTIPPLGLFTKRAIAPYPWLSSANLHSNLSPFRRVTTIIIDSDTAITAVVIITGRLHRSPQSQELKLRDWLEVQSASTDLCGLLRFRLKSANCCSYDPYYYFEQISIPVVNFLFFYLIIVGRTRNSD